MGQWPNATTSSSSLALALPAAAAEPGPLVRLGSDRFRQADRVTAVAYSTDGKRLATAGEGRGPRLGRGRRPAPADGPGRGEGLRLGPPFRRRRPGPVRGGRHRDKGVTFRHLDPATGKRVATTVVVPNDRQRLFEPEARFSPDGARLAVFSEDGARLRVIDTATRKEVWAEKSANGRGLVPRVPAGRQGPGRRDGARAGRGSSTWPPERSAHDYAIEGGGIIWNLAFSPDGKDLVAEVSNPVPNRVVRFEAATGTVRWTLRDGRGQGAGLHRRRQGRPVLGDGRGPQGDVPVALAGRGDGQAAGPGASTPGSGTRWPSARTGKVMAVGGPRPHLPVGPGDR